MRVVAVVLLATVALSAQAPISKPQSQTKPATSVGSTNLPLKDRCADPAVKLDLEKALPAGGTGGVTLNGQVCNLGTEDYLSKYRLNGQVTVFTYHPPKTAAQEANMQTFDHPLAAELKKGACRPVKQTYSIPNVVRWGQAATGLPPGQHQAVKLFSLCVVNSDPAHSSFAAKDNCNNNNDCIEIQVPYIEKQ